MKVSGESGISMPIKNLISIVATVAIGVWAYFGIVERINKLESDNKLGNCLSRQTSQRGLNLSCNWFLLLSLSVRIKSSGHLLKCSTFTCFHH